MDIDPIASARSRAQRMRGAALALKGILERSQRPKAPPPAPEKGIPLLELGRRREDGILRVSWCELEAEPFLQARLWKRDVDGVLRPTRRGAVIRLREMPEFAEAIAKALDLAQAYGAKRA